MIPGRIARKFHAKYRVLNNGCWEWIPAGKPKIWVPEVGMFVTAARLSWEIHGGEIPQREHWRIRHLCANGRCVNPEHLYLSDHSDQEPYAVRGSLLPIGGES